MKRHRRLGQRVPTRRELLGHTRRWRARIDRWLDECRLAGVAVEPTRASDLERLPRDLAGVPR